MNISKVVDEEGFWVELFKHGIQPLVHHIVNLLNHVVRLCFPHAWSHHIIHRIHKMGFSADPNNYRTVMLGHTFLKLYATALHL
jgi:hypothetical protein